MPRTTLLDSIICDADVFVYIGHSDVDGKCPRDHIDGLKNNKEDAPYGDHDSLPQCDQKDVAIIASCLSGHLAGDMDAPAKNLLQKVNARVHIAFQNPVPSDHAYKYPISALDRVGILNQWGWDDVNEYKDVLRRHLDYYVGLCFFPGDNVLHYPRSLWTGWVAFLNGDPDDYVSTCSWLRHNYPERCWTAGFIPPLLWSPSPPECDEPPVFCGDY